jgi:hypothetical protein
LLLQTLEKPESPFKFLPAEDSASLSPDLESLGWERCAHPCPRPPEPQPATCIGGVLARLDIEPRQGLHPKSCAAAAAQETEIAQLRHNLGAHQALVGELYRRTAELEALLEAARSELPAKDVAYAQLKEALFQLQRRYARAQAELAASRQETKELRAMLQAGRQP